MDQPIDLSDQQTNWHCDFVYPLDHKNLSSGFRKRSMKDDIGIERHNDKNCPNDLVIDNLWRKISAR